MKLSLLRIRNFRCFESTEISIDTMHALVGSNNAGKSSVLRALDIFFNPSTRKIDEESFHHKDTTKRIEIECLFTCLTNEDKESLGPY
ncbi:MAG: ATP-dependent nuclease, partial [Phycisphaerales bacterium JB065]